MTFFLVLAGLKTVETVVRGYGPPSPGLFYSTSAHERSKRGDYGNGVTATTGRIR